MKKAGCPAGQPAFFVNWLKNPGRSPASISTKLGPVPVIDRIPLAPGNRRIGPDRIVVTAAPDDRPLAFGDVSPSTGKR